MAKSSRSTQSKPAGNSASGSARTGRGGSSARNGARREASSGAAIDRESYWIVSMQPLHVLVFLLPLIVIYEVGSVLYLSDVSAGTRETIKAQRLLGDFFEVFGVAGLFVPGLALVTVLLVWHFLSRDPWRVRWNSVAGMGAESVAWTLPLIVLAAVLMRAAATFTSGGELARETGGLFALVQGPVELSWQARLTISIGAGLYEEMLFRLVGIALIHLIVKDLMGAKSAAASVVAIVGTAVAFALYHNDVWHRATGQFAWRAFVFYAAAGTYLGIVYVQRGLGIVVGTHAMYDVAVLILFDPLNRT